MKDVLFRHDNARPRTSLYTCEAIGKMGWTVLSKPAHGPDLASSDGHLFDPVKKALDGHHFANDSELKRNFHDALRSRDREFYNIGVHRLTQRWQNCVENDGVFVGK
jgi:histone-lysine N-methyltransferase SETMAR